MAARLTLLTTGTTRHPERFLLRGGRRQQVELPAMAGLIEPSDGPPLLFDAGLAPRFHEATRPWPARLYALLSPTTCPPAAAASEQLRARGLAPEAIATVVISHFHADHVAGLMDFPGARFLCTRAAYDAMQGRKGLAAVRAGQLPALLPADFTARLGFIDDLPMVALDARMAPFARGHALAPGLWLVPLPGHAPGHCGLWVTTHAAPVFLIGDACWLSRGYRERRLPGWAAGGVLHDLAGVATTLGLLHELHRRRPDVRIIPSHCPEGRALLEGTTP